MIELIRKKFCERSSIIEQYEIKLFQYEMTKFKFKKLSTVQTVQFFNLFNISYKQKKSNSRIDYVTGWSIYMKIFKYLYNAYIFLDYSLQLFDKRYRTIFMKNVKMFVKRKFKNKVRK